LIAQTPHTLFLLTLLLEVEVLVGSKVAFMVTSWLLVDVVSTYETNQ
jgi:hypothetical protein